MAPILNHFYKVINKLKKQVVTYPMKIYRITMSHLTAVQEKFCTFMRNICRREIKLLALTRICLEWFWFYVNENKYTCGQSLCEKVETLIHAYANITDLQTSTNRCIVHVKDLPPTTYKYNVQYSGCRNFSILFDTDTSSFDSMCLPVRILAFVNRSFT